MDVCQLLLNSRGFSPLPRFNPALALPPFPTFLSLQSGVLPVFPMGHHDNQLPNYETPPAATDDPPPPPGNAFLKRLQNLFFPAPPPLFSEEYYSHSFFPGNPCSPFLFLHVIPFSFCTLKGSFAATFPPFGIRPPCLPSKRAKSSLIEYVRDFIPSLLAGWIFCTNSKSGFAFRLFMSFNF